MTQLPWNPAGVLSHLVEAGTDLGPPLYHLLHAERLDDPPDNVRGFTSTVPAWQRYGIHKDRPWLPYWVNLQHMVCQAMDVTPDQLRWWMEPVYDPDYQPGSDN